MCSFHVSWNKCTQLPRSVRHRYRSTRCQSFRNSVVLGGKTYCPFSDITQGLGQIVFICSSSIRLAEASRRRMQNFKQARTKESIRRGVHHVGEL